MTPGRITLPEKFWQQLPVRTALRTRDVAALFQQAANYGISQGRLAAATGMAQGRVSEIANKRRRVERLDLFERIADGLTMPDDARRLLGLAPARDSTGAAFDLGTWPEVVRVYDTQAAAAAEIGQEAATAREIDILAVRGLGLLALNDSLLRAHLNRPTPPRLRVLLLAGDSPALARRAAEIGESPLALASGIDLAQERLRDLAADGDVQVHRYQALPVWRLIRCDTVWYVASFSAGWEGHESAVYKMVETPAGPLIAGFRRMFDAMLDESERTV